MFLWQKINNLGCVLYKQKYVLSDMNDASALFEELRSKSIEQVEGGFSYDLLIKEMIDTLKFKNKLHEQLKLVNKHYKTDNKSRTKDYRSSEFCAKAEQELYAAYHIGFRKEDGCMGFSKWSNENTPTDDRILNLYEKVITFNNEHFSKGRGASHSLLLTVINKQDNERLKKSSTDIVAFMKNNAWHMFPYHTVKEVLAVIDESKCAKKKQLTSLFVQVLKVNSSIAIEPSGENTNIGYDMKDDKDIEDLETIGHTPLPIAVSTRGHLKRKAAPTYMPISEPTVVNNNFKERNKTFIPDDDSFVTDTCKSPSFEQRKKSSSESSNKMPSKDNSANYQDRSATDDLSSITNTPASTNTYATLPPTPTKQNTPAYASIPKCTPDSDGKSRRLFDKTTPTLKKGKALRFNPFKSIGANINQTKKDSYKAKAKSLSKDGDRIELFTSKPMRKKDGTATIIVALTAATGHGHVSKAMYMFRGNYFTHMCEFMSGQRHAIGSGKYCDKLLNGFKNHYAQKRRPGTSSADVIGNPNWPKYLSTAILKFEDIHTDKDLTEMVNEVENGMKNLLHDEFFSDWFLLGVWIGCKGKYMSSTSEEIAMDFANLAENNGFEPDNMREYFKTDGDGSKYVKIIATDQSNILKNISTIPFYHTKDVALDYLFLDTDIMEIIPDFIGTYEEKYSSLVITNKQQHDDDFLYFH